MGEPLEPPSSWRKVLVGGADIAHDDRCGHHVEMLTIRPATPKDVPEILKLIRELAQYEKLAHFVVITAFWFSDVILLE